MKRPIDLAFAAAALALTLPLLAAIGLAIFIETGHPIFFTQTRVGRNGRAFRIWKFRSMRASSRGAAITAATDPRITRVGAFLRKTKLDELPQLWNVIRGDMSIVGPRPELPLFVDGFQDRFRDLLRVRPGLVDAATLAFADEEHLLAASADPIEFYEARILPAKLALSARYLATRTFATDLRLIADTLLVASKRFFRG